MFSYCMKHFFPSFTFECLLFLIERGCMHKHIWTGVGRSRGRGRKSSSPSRAPEAGLHPDLSWRQTLNRLSYQVPLYHTFSYLILSCLMLVYNLCTNFKIKERMHFISLRSYTAINTISRGYMTNGFIFLKYNGHTLISFRGTT